MSTRKRGEVWQADLSAARDALPATLRPVVVLQAQALLDAVHPSTLVAPLTTSLVDDAAPLRLRIEASGTLEQDLDVLVDQMRALDNRRLVTGPLTRLSARQQKALDEALRDVLDL